MERIGNMQKNLPEGAPLEKGKGNLSDNIQIKADKRFQVVLEKMISQIFLHLCLAARKAAAEAGKQNSGDRITMQN
jgi:hypothetical protein